MRKIRGKEGLSPVIATVLLIALVVIIALLIFLWARRFVGEAVQKQGMSADQACSQISLDVRYSNDGSNELYVTNAGNIPVYGLEVKLVSGGDKTNDRIDANVGGGQTDTFTVDGIESADSVSVTPSILGETSSSKKEYVCSQEIEAVRAE